MEKRDPMRETLYQGKSKTVCRGPDDRSLVIRYRDTATALNGEKRAELAGKGLLNAAISHLLFAYLAENGIETHLIKVLDGDAALVKKAEIVPVEVIVRNRAAGGFSRKYGVSEGTALRNTVVEFCLKSDALGDPMLNRSHITALGLASGAEIAEMARQALCINELLRTLCEKAGMELIDFKLEFGRHDDSLILCDEISPDSCRLWDRDTGKKLDKDRFRQDLGDVLGGYREVLRRLRHARPV